MTIRVYLDNQLITYILRAVQDLATLPEMKSLVLLSNIKTINIEFLVSEESLAEIRQLPENSVRRKDLEELYFKLKEGKPVIRNATVLYDDKIATYNSSDVFMCHPYDDTDLNKVRQFLRSKGNTNDFDARYVANAMLPENKINVFLTADKRSLWQHKMEIKEKFGVDVKLPSELVEYLKHVR